MGRMRKNRLSDVSAYGAKWCDLLRAVFQAHRNHKLTLGLVTVSQKVFAPIQIS